MQNTAKKGGKLPKKNKMNYKKNKIILFRDLLYMILSQKRKLKAYLVIF